MDSSGYAFISRINSFEKENPEKPLEPEVASGYTFKPWRLVSVDHEPGSSKYKFTIRNDSGGSYIARPFDITYRKADITIVPRTKIEVGSIPVFRLLNRTIMPNNRHTVPITAKFVEPGYGPVPQPVLKKLQQRFEKIQSINLGHYQSIRSMRQGTNKIQSKRMMGKNLPLHYSPKGLDTKFSFALAEAAKDYFEAGGNVKASWEMIENE